MRLALLSLLVLVSPRTALADDAATTFASADGYGYRFNDDAMQAGGLRPTDPRLHVVKHAARGLLIRPRTSFVPEMLKSVENL
jgi:hypothetical protein